MYIRTQRALAIGVSDSFFWKELKNISNKLNKKYNKKMNIISFPYNCSEDEDLLNILSEFSKKIREKLKIGLV